MTEQGIISVEEEKALSSSGRRSINRQIGGNLATLSSFILATGQGSQPTLRGEALHVLNACCYIMLKFTNSNTP